MARLLRTMPQAYSDVSHSRLIESRTAELDLSLQTVGDCHKLQDPSIRLAKRGLE